MCQTTRESDDHRPVGRRFRRGKVRRLHRFRSPVGCGRWDSLGIGRAFARPRGVVPIALENPAQPSFLQESVSITLHITAPQTEICVICGSLPLRGLVGSNDLSCPIVLPLPASLICVNLRLKSSFASIRGSIRVYSRSPFVVRKRTWVEP